MALRPSNKHLPRLTVPQVLEVRNLYFMDNWSLSELAVKYDTSRGLIQKAVNGIGKYYGSIEDDIPQGLKDDHLTSKELIARNRKYGHALQSGKTHEEALIISGLPERYTKMDWD